MIVCNVYGHLGYELYPKGFSTHKIGKWINTSVNHNQHHQYVKEIMAYTSYGGTGGCTPFAMIMTKNLTL